MISTIAVIAAAAVSAAVAHAESASQYLIVSPPTSECSDVPVPCAMIATSMCPFFNLGPTSGDVPMCSVRRGHGLLRRRRWFLR